MFLELVRRGHYSLDELHSETNYISLFQDANPTTIQAIGLRHLNLKQESQALKSSEKLELPTSNIESDLSAFPFVHLHNHSQYSVLESTTKISDLIDMAVEFDMPAVAITDYANLYGAFHFADAIYKHPENKAIIEHNKLVEKGDLDEPKKDLTIKGIIGCELTICQNHLDHKVKDNGRSVVFLAKNKKGYHNISKMSSIAHTEGFYYVPRIDKDVVKQHCSDLIVLSGGLRGEIADLILSVGEKQAEEALLWWKDLFWR